MQPVMWGRIRLANNTHHWLCCALQLELTEVTVVGASMGCAVVWSYVELFGEERLKQVGLAFLLLLSSERSY